MRALLPALVKPATADSFVRAVLQRKCACGGEHAGEGACDECRQKQEQGTMQRAAIGASPAVAAPAAVHEVLRSPGQPLDAATRAFMEPRFASDFSHVRVQAIAPVTGPTPLTISHPGEPAEREAEQVAKTVVDWPGRYGAQAGPRADLSRVRLHTDAHAAESARAVNALAYTVGGDIVFGAGQYAPRTAAGRRLLAHELTHVLQQTGGTRGGARAFALQRQESKPTIPIPVFDELDPTVIVPDLPAVPEVVRGQQVKLSTVRKALAALAGKKSGGTTKDCTPAIGFERAGSGEFKGLCCHGSLRSAENCCQLSDIGLITGRCCTRRNEVVLDGICVTLPEVKLPPQRLPKPPGKPAPAPAPQPKPAPPSISVHFEKDKPAAAGGAIGASLTGDGPEALAGLIALLQADPTLQVQLVGHASPEGTPEHNQTLATRRAEAVADALAGAGIAAGRITDLPTSDLAAECQKVRAGVVSCGEAGSTGPADRQVVARFSRAAP